MTIAEDGAVLRNRNQKLIDSQEKVINVIIRLKGNKKK